MQLNGELSKYNWAVQERADKRCAQTVEGKVNHKKVSGWFQANQWAMSWENQEEDRTRGSSVHYQRGKGTDQIENLGTAGGEEEKIDSPMI